MGDGLAEQQMIKRITMQIGQFGELHDRLPGQRQRIKSMTGTLRNQVLFERQRNAKLEAPPIEI